MTAINFYSIFSMYYNCFIFGYIFIREMNHNIISFKHFVKRSNIYISNEAYRVDTLIVMPIVALPIVVCLLIYVMFAPVKKESLGEETL